MEHEAAVRLGIFFGVFAVLAACEVLAPRRPLVLGRGRRWLTNWAISVAGVMVIALLKVGLGAAAVIAAIDAREAGWGLFNRVDWPVWLEVALVFVALDFAIWLQHLASHKIPMLWRLHRVHHADRDIDVTTAIRFHPLELALSMVFKIGLVYLLGGPVVAVVIFEVVLNGAAMFNHANLRLPERVDRWLRRVIVTPDMHRVHHSVHRAEHDANYGFNLAIWDRLFGTYVAQPANGHLGMKIGLGEHQTNAPTRIGWSLTFPFR